MNKFEWNRLTIVHCHIFTTQLISPCISRPPDIELTPRQVRMLPPITDRKFSIAIPWVVVENSINKKVLLK